MWIRPRRGYRPPGCDRPRSHDPGARRMTPLGDPAPAASAPAASAPVASATVTPATVAHAAAMATIHRMAFPPKATWGRSAIATQLALPGVFGWIDPHGGMILARVAADEMEVLTLAVIPKVRRQGVGTRLLDAALTLARSRSARTAFLEVAVNNNAARALYERSGFQPAGKRPRYYADGTDALVLRRTLSPDATTAG
jgi:ribosomal-protein-alanine N-acetyltransferase